MKLTALMREALEHAHRHGEIRRVHDDTPGQPPWPFPAASLAALTRRDLLASSKRRSKRGHQMDVWKITDAGREEFKARARPVKDAVHGMNAKGAAASRVMVGGVWTDVRFPEPEKIDADRLDPKHAEDARARHLDVVDPRDKARLLKASLSRKAA